MKQIPNPKKKRKIGDITGKIMQLESYMILKYGMIFFLFRNFMKNLNS